MLTCIVIQGSFMSDPKLERLNRLSEEEFRELVLMQLLRKMGYEKVRLRHGTDEYGKDITCCINSALGSTYYAIVAKVGDISGAASGKLSGLLMTVKEQIDQAFSMPIEDIADDKSNNIPVNRVIVWTTGKIRNHAIKRVTDGLDTRYKNNILFKDGETTIEYLDKFYPSFFTIGDASIANYFDGAKKAYGHVEELYSIGGRSNQNTLSAIFVSPTLQHIPYRRTKQARQERRPNKRYSFSKFMSLPNNPVLILGEIGSGKSTLLHRIVLNTIEQNEKDLKRYPIPLLLRFKKLDLNTTQPIHKALEEEYSRLSEDPTPRDIEDDLQKGNLLVLLDGLDELEDESHIEHALNILRNFAHSYTQTKVVVTSRMLEILRKTNILALFSVFRIEDFSINQMRQLILKLFRDDTSDGKHLIKLITEPSVATSLEFTPMTLTLIANLYQNGFKDLPANLTELFEKYTELALGRWDISKDISSQIDWKKKQLLLRKVGWQLLKSSSTEIDFGSLKSHLHNLNEDRDLNIDEEAFLREIIDRSRLLILNDDNNYEFKHRAFMDYFAGMELTTKVDSVDIVVKNFPNASWSRVIFFACGLKSEGLGEEYLKAIMENVPVDECGALHYALNLGFLTQAAYLAHKSIKIEAVRRTLIYFVDGWDELAEDFNEAYSSGRIKQLIPHMFALYVYAGMIHFSIGSSTLSNSLSHLTELYLSNKEKSVSSEVNSIKDEWLIFCLTIALSNASLISDFITLIRDGGIKNPALLHIINMEAELLLEQAWINETDKTAVKDLLKWLQPKLTANEGYIEKLSSSKPMLLADTNKTSAD
jgi:hypothetical protein